MDDIYLWGKNNHRVRIDSGLHKQNTVIMDTLFMNVTALGRGTAIGPPAV